MATVCEITRFSSMKPLSGIEIIRRVICPVVGAFGRYVAAALQAAEFLWGCGYPGRRSFALRTHLPLGSHAPPLRGEGGRVLLGYYAPPLRGEDGRVAPGSGGSRPKTM